MVVYFDIFVFFKKKEKMGWEIIKFLEMLKKFSWKIKKEFADICLNVWKKNPKEKNIIYNEHVSIVHM